MPIRGPRSVMTGSAAAWTGTLPISSPLTLQAPPGNGIGWSSLRAPVVVGQDGILSGGYGRRTELRHRSEGYLAGHAPRSQGERGRLFCVALGIVAARR